MDKVSPAIRILIADDHPIFRGGVRRVLAGEADFQVVGEAADGEQTVKLARQFKPDILLLDLAMPRRTGLEALRELSVAPLPVRPIVLAAAVESAQIVEALQLGARGVVLKDSAPELLIRSIHAVAAGQYWVGRNCVSDLVNALRQIIPRNVETARERAFGLTSRELEIVSVIVAGYTNKDVAQKFTISEDTVKRHLTNIYDKLGVSNRLELALFALRNQLVGNL
jgi:two-component system, NarL family, nitrate/nitrite response regulator NarL